MKFKNGYLLAGIFWALFLAPVAAYAIVALVSGMLWIYVFGDNPWPAATDWVIPIIGLVVFLSVAACCIYVARRRGLQREAQADTDTPQEWRTIYLVAGVPLILIVISAFSLYQRAHHQAEALVATQQRQADFIDLLNTRHIISDLVVRRTNDGDFEASVSMSGEREGPYRLLWTVNSLIYGEILSGDMDNVNLDVEGNELAFRVPQIELANRYRDNFLNVGEVLVDEPFELVVTLVPKIGADAVDRWPLSERQRWKNDESRLQSVVVSKFQVRFRIEHDGTIVYPTP